MNITVIKTTENPDGSADCIVRFDAEGLGFLVQEGVLAILKQYIEQCKKEAKRKGKNEPRKTNRTNVTR
jgi:hypothetical protein